MSERVSIVTGATSGIGRSTAKKLSAAGHRIIAVGRDRQSLEELATELGDTTVAVAADVTVESDLERVIAAVKDAGRLDVLVNAAGIIANGTIESTSMTDWDAMMDVNVRSVVHLSQLCVPMLKASRGNIVNVSSVAGTRSFPNLLAYCVSKAAIDQITRCSALDLAPFGIRVNAVNPGVVITNLHLRGGMSDEKYEAFVTNAANTHPIGRAGEADEVADLIVFLASETAGWITGVTYAIDGGRALTCAR